MSIGYRLAIRALTNSTDVITFRNKIIRAAMKRIVFISRYIARQIRARGVILLIHCVNIFTR